MRTEMVSTAILSLGLPLRFSRRAPSLDCSELPSPPYLLQVLAAAPSATVPALFGHGVYDGLIPPEHGRALHVAYGGAPKRLVQFPGDHNSARPPEFIEAAADFAAETLGVAAPASLRMLGLGAVEEAPDAGLWQQLMELVGVWRRRPGALWESTLPVLWRAGTLKGQGSTGH